MGRLIAILFMTGGLLSGGAWTPSPSEAPRRKAPFCPECWKFLTDPGDVDLMGRCSQSGKKPVELETVTVGWIWCPPHKAWHRRPCAKGSSFIWESTALLVPAGSERISVRAYCPGDRMISDIGHAGLKCPVCARPFVGADTVDRRWYWCAAERTWLDQPSPENSRLHCCSARSGAVLAYPWRIPLLSHVSADGSVRQGMRVTSEWLAAHLDDPHLAVLHIGFDPGEPSASKRSTYLDGHILGARQVAWNEFAIARKGLPNEMPPAESLVQMVRALGIDVDDRIILYDTGFGLEAARAYLTMEYLGLGENAAILDGQWARWKALRLPQSRMPEEVEPSAFMPRLHPEILIALAAMKDLSWLSQQGGTPLTLLDARAGEEFSGLRAGKGIFRAGHVPGASNLCWADTFETLEEAELRSDYELWGLFQAAGARPGGTVVAYCRTGVEASHLYFLAKYLGYVARFYDGSYYEWSREEDVTFRGNWARR